MGKMGKTYRWCISENCEIDEYGRYYMENSRIFFLLYGGETKNRIVFRLLYGYNVGKEKESSMQKKTPDYDNVFKTMKMKHKRLYQKVILKM